MACWFSVYLELGVKGQAIDLWLEHSVRVHPVSLYSDLGVGGHPVNLYLELNMRGWFICLPLELDAVVEVTSLTSDVSFSLEDTLHLTLILRTKLK